jgi:GNAT superfamily N-acetyltransferase
LQDAALAWMNECEGWLALGRRSFTMYRVEDKHGLICAWRTADVAFMPNFIHVPPGLESVLQEILTQPELQAPIDQSEAVTEIRLLDPGDGRAAKIESALAGAGFARSDSMPVMVKKWDGDSPDPPETEGGPDICRIDPKEDKAAFSGAFDVIQRSFGGPDVLNRFFVPDDGTVIPYVARLDGKAVSAAVVWPFWNVYGIYSVSTLESHRGQGLATRLLQRMLRDAGGFAFSSLRTTDALIPLYERLGYREAGRCLCFRNRIRWRRIPTQGEQAGFQPTAFCR